MRWRTTWSLRTGRRVIPVRDPPAALERYRRLGFQVRAYGRGTEYGYADRGKVSLHLSEWDEHDPSRTGSVVYIYVSDADALFAEWVSSGVEGRFSEVRETDYEMKEFGYVEPRRDSSPRGVVTQ
jgi:hypothetical protein